VLKDYGATDGCSEWDTTSSTMPYIFYSGDKMAVNWATGILILFNTIISIYV